MNNQQPAVLATDLDGTFIPLDNNQTNRRDLERLRQHFQSGDKTLVYVTGRHLESAQQVMRDQNLPQPDWIICDVGTTICRYGDDGQFHTAKAYVELLSDIIAPMPIEKLREELVPIAGLRLQEPEKQGRFKLSFYCDGHQVDALTQRIGEIIHGQPYSIISSVDPFNGDGLIDLLPHDASKAYALRWWAQHVGHPETSIVFAGDSGNDLAALTAGYRTIVVGNADDQVIQQTREAHRDAGWTDRLYIAEAVATSGVLEGCRFHGLISNA